MSTFGPADGDWSKHTSGSGSCEGTYLPPILSDEQKRQLREDWLATYKGPREEAESVLAVFEIQHLAAAVGIHDEDLDDACHNLAILNGNPFKEKPQGVIYAAGSISPAQQSPH